VEKSPLLPAVDETVGRVKIQHDFPGVSGEPGHGKAHEESFDGGVVGEDFVGSAHLTGPSLRIGQLEPRRQPR
jgi:hypothetical protein